jgi:transcriptional regulator with XRE-family HTH domain
MEASGGQDLEDATNGIVTRSYIANLRKGRIGNPGYEKLVAIAKAMDFSPGLWFEDVDSEIPLGEADKKLNLAERINRLFETVINEKTGAPHTNAEGLRTGSISDPTLAKLVALADVFGVDPAYFLDRGARPPVFRSSVLMSRTISEANCRRRRAEAPPQGRMPRGMRAARSDESFRAVPPGTRSLRSACRRLGVRVRSATHVNKRLSESRRSTSESASGSTAAIDAREGHSYYFVPCTYFF